MFCLKVSLLPLGCYQPCQGLYCHALPCIFVMLLWCTGSLSHCCVSGKCCDVPMSSPRACLSSLSSSCLPTSWKKGAQLWLGHVGNQSLRNLGWQQGVYEFPGIWMLTRCCLSDVLAFWQTGAWGGAGDSAGAPRWLMKPQPGCTSAVNSRREAEISLFSRATGFDSSPFICSESAEVFSSSSSKAVLHCPEGAVIHMGSQEKMILPISADVCKPRQFWLQLLSEI